MENKLQQLFRKKNKNLISYYYTAGYPKLDDTTKILKALQSSQVDFVEIGMPFSDPVADGPTIQESSMIALNNGMHIDLLLQQLQTSQHENEIPIILMGYFNPVLQYGLKKFLQKCSDAGVSGVILPDLPFDYYREKYTSLFEQYNISFIPLIAPNTSDERIRFIDTHTDGMLYIVSSHGTTGRKIAIQNQIDYFERILALNLKNPIAIGFGIQSAADVTFVHQYANAAIIGSSFVQYLKEQNDFTTFSTFLQ